MSSRLFHRLFIANRGEVAVRVARTCDALGIVPVFGVSEADRTAPYLRGREHVVRGPSRAAESYLDRGKVVQAAVQTGVVPKPVLSMPLFVELGSEARFPGLHLEPRARLSWTFAASAHGSVAAGAADFAWMAGAVDVCPVRLALATRGTLPFADLRACGRIEIGKLDATGEGTVSTPLSDSRLWLGAGIPFNARIAPRGLGGVFFEVEAGPRFALLRDEFQVGPTRSLVFQPPPLAFSGGIGAGIGFR